jgi:hypothetical protein
MLQFYNLNNNLKTLMAAYNNGIAAIRADGRLIAPSSGFSNSLTASIPTVIRNLF